MFTFGLNLHVSFSCDNKGNKTIERTQKLRDFLCFAHVILTCMHLLELTFEISNIGSYIMTMTVPVQINFMKLSFMQESLEKFTNKSQCFWRIFK